MSRNWVTIGLAVILLVILAGISATGCASPSPSTSSDMPEAKRLLLTKWDIFSYDLKLIPDAEFSGKGLWGNPRLAQEEAELRDDYYFYFHNFYIHEWMDIRGTHIAFNDRSYIQNTVAVHKSIQTAKRAFANAEPFFPWTYGNWVVNHVGDETKAWQSNVFNVNDGGTFEVIVCFRKGVVLVSLEVRAYAYQPCPEDIESFVLDLARKIESKIP